MKILANDIIGENAISMQSGTMIYEIISTPLLSNKDVELDFDGVKLFASPFFNASIGLLLKDIEIDDLQRSLKIVNLSKVGNQLLNRVIKNAIEYYNMDPNSIENMKNIIKGDKE